MPPSDNPGRTRTMWLWLAVIALLVIALLVWLLDPSGKADEGAPAASTTAARDAEWRVAPSGPAVPVTLPEAQVTTSPLPPGATPTAEVTAVPKER